MKNLNFYLGLGLFIVSGFFPVAAFMNYDPDCVPTAEYLCANEGINPAPTNLTPTTPTQTNPTPTSPSQPQQGQAGVHIYYESTAGHHIYAQFTYQGKAGEVVDLSKFQKKLATYEFDHYTPSEGKITLQGGKNLRASLVYRKKFRPLSTPNTITSAPTNSITPTTTQATTNAENTKNIEDLNSQKMKVISGIFDDYFQKNDLSLTQKQAILSSLKMSFEKAKNNLSASEKKQYEASYNVILFVIDNYRF